ncbi:MAG TPA: hypothetical protein VFU63_07600, partial [Ktedonobacterales bacterium]|nr:hypothetical protein [Ktedonobacterales bacterium]
VDMRYLRTFLKRWYLYAIPIIVLPVLMTVYGYNKLMLYQSGALCRVDLPRILSAQDLGWNPWISAAQNESQAMGGLLQSETFAVEVATHTNLAKQLDLTTQAGKDAAFQHITADVSVYPAPQGDNFLYISVLDKDPHLAQQIAVSLIDAYTTDFQQNRKTIDDNAIKFYQQQLATAQGQQDQDTASLQEYLHTHPGANVSGTVDPTFAQLEQQVSQDQSTVSSFSQQITTLQQDEAALPSGSTSILHVQDPPRLPLKPTLQKSTLLTKYTGEYGLGAAAAIVGAIVIGLTLLDRKVYSVQDLRKIEEELELELPSIEALPVLAGARRAASGNTKYAVKDGILVPVLAALPQISLDITSHNALNKPRAASATVPEIDK